MHNHSFLLIFKEHWEEGHLTLLTSWLGKISMIKTNVLLRTLYPIQMVTILYSYKTLKKLNRWLSCLYWECANPKMSTLQLSPTDRGLDLLNDKVFTVDPCLCTTSVTYTFKWINCWTISLKAPSPSSWLLKISAIEAFYYLCHYFDDWEHCFGYFTCSISTDIFRNVLRSLKT